MSNYLEDLTLSLAQGMARLPEEVRARQANYFLQAQRPDGGFHGREGNSDLYYTGFGLRGLALAGELHGSVAERAAGFLKSRLAANVPIVDFLSLIYGAALLELSAGIDIFADRPPSWREQCAQTLAQFRRADGGYAKTDAGEASSMYHTFLVAICHQILNVPLPDPEGIVAFVQARKRIDGGFVEIAPMRRGGANPTAAAIGLLKILGGLDAQTREQTVDFLAELQTDEGGIKANDRIPIADLLSTFTGLVTLGDLQAIHELDLPAVREFILSLQQPEGGFLAAAWDDGIDVEYSFYGLGGLAIVAAAL